MTPLHLPHRIGGSGVDREQVDVGQRPRITPSHAGPDDQAADARHGAKHRDGLGQPLVQQLPPPPRQLHAACLACP